MQTNMLCAKNVKRHGMSSSKWLTKDKITQYKGLVNLYARDTKVFDFDTTNARKTLQAETFRLRKEIEHQREVLDNATFGDRQELRNTLSGNRNLQLAYQMTIPTKVIDVLYQQNFNKRKLLDRVNYRMKEKTAKLVKLKLEHAEYGDRIKYESRDQIPEEETAQKVTASVQDAVLKLEVATEIMDTYQKMLTLLKKDARFFDAMLATLQVDGANQGKCILKVTEIGQLATEYLDNKRREYGILETIVIASMREQDDSLKQVTDQLKTLNDNVKYLIRRDSLVDIFSNKKSQVDYNQSVLTGNIANIAKILNKLREITIVAKISEIFPRMKDQKKQKLRLEVLINKASKDRNTLMNKSRHAEQVYCSIGHSMVTTTFWYKEEKARLLEEIKEQEETRKASSCLMKHRAIIYLRIRTRLQQLSEILRLVSVPAAAAKDLKDKGKKKVVTTVDPRSTPKLKKADSDEKDAMKIINVIIVKLTILTKAATDQRLEASKMEVAETMYEKFVDGMIDKTIVLREGYKDSTLFSYVALDDPQVPSRIAIKARSDELCLANAKTEFDI